ncbi:metal-dependent transcriptional regulator [Corynebacterium tapiri]|uniref:Diphtheria toxin repressor n=1 Tax=Corynebacterium tapiri TaxID=1448266 RepID=A0A5C4U5Y0_9CORY|nr:metal-dependent transcriptional regulator [Corynebacterium tapiri]TNL99207.1 metal-dependent transcriptional regulator [Corynebacterium tapiri]
MKDLVDTTEMYLRTIYELEEEGVTPLRARIAERLEQSGPTVSQTVARMERDGLVNVQSDRSLVLTPEGRQLATNVMRKHRLAERLLTDILGLDIDKVHEEACRWEHVMSEEVERRVVAVLKDPSRSPFGNPIPGLDQLGTSVSAVDHAGVRLSNVGTGNDIEMRILQINEVVQMDHRQFTALDSAGIVPGATVTATIGPDGITLLAPGKEEIEVPADIAHAIRVELS